MEKAHVQMAKDGQSIDFVTAENLPASPKKFRNSGELKEFYRFVSDNDLRRESLVVIEKILMARMAIKAQEKAAKAKARATKRAQKKKLN